MVMVIADGGVDRSLNRGAVDGHLAGMIASWATPPKRVLLLPPDHTRLYSEAGLITDILYERLTSLGARVEIMPALGTHAAMTEKQLRMMFGERIPLAAFRIHDWRNDVVGLGEIPGSFLQAVSGGLVDFSMQVMVNRALVSGDYDQILSIGQVVPHEVVGMANYTKNLCVGVGGADLINKSHFLGAVCNMEKALGRADTPVRRVFNEAHNRFLAHLPVTFLLTVVAKSAGAYHLRGLYASADETAFLEAVRLSQQVNLDLVDRPFKKAVVFLTPKEFASTWLGNKAIYRTRMAMADEGELIILAPAVKEFGEDKEIDRLIRKYGYFGTPKTLKAVEENEELRENLGAAAHLIHGSSEGRFHVTYCTDPALLSRKEVESVGFAWADVREMSQRYDPERLEDGWQVVDGEELYYISNPALGLWAPRAAFV